MLGLAWCLIVSRSPNPSVRSIAFLHPFRYKRALVAMVVPKLMCEIHRVGICYVLLRSPLDLRYCLIPQVLGRELCMQII